MIVEAELELLEGQAPLLLPDAIDLHERVKNRVKQNHRDEFVVLDSKWWELKNLETVLRNRCAISDETHNTLSQSREILDEIVCTLHTSRI